LPHRIITTDVTETEVKLRWQGTAKAAQALIEQHGYTLTEPRTLESNQLFDLPSRVLQQADQILRLRRISLQEGGTRAIVTYKGPASREVYKSREEIEFEVSDPEAFTLVLERLGYHPGFCYEKYRATFKASGDPGLITVDQTPIGIFLELEGPPEWIDSTARRLGLPIAGFLTVSYPGLYREHREQHPDAPPNMTFDLQEPYTPRQNDLRTSQKH
jgi:adenylate cyclase, class 2